MNSGLVSVIIPCYNQAGFMEETIQSVLKSTYPSIEIILINDGSTDDTEAVGKRLADKHNQIFYYSQLNSGPSVARNFGIETSRGEYILPLDSDDIISSDYIAEAVKAFEADAEVKVVYCEAEKFGNEKGEWKLKPFSLQALAVDNMIFVTALFKKDDWRKAGGYAHEMLSVGEDWEFWISMLKNGGKVVKLPLIGFYYRIRSNSRRKGITADKKREMIDFVNGKHKEFIYEQLNGPLRYQRTHSRKYNKFLRFFGLLEN